MQPFMKNVAVEYAAKALPGGELAQALKDLQDGKTTIEAVTALIEGGTVSNAKPIYFHPITCLQPDSAATPEEIFSFSLIILNNDPAQFDTWDKLIAYFRSTAEKISPVTDYARFPCTGSVYVNNTKLLLSTIECRLSPSAEYQFLGVKTTDFIRMAISFNGLSGTPRVFDSVNKIN